MTTNRESRVNSDAQTQGGALSRAQLLRAAGAGIALAVVPQFAAADAPPGGRLVFPGGGRAPALEFLFYPQVSGRYTPEGVIDILNVLVTMQRWAVAINVANLSGPIDPGISPVAVSNQQASLVANAARVDFLESLGARSLTDTFTIGVSAGPFSVASLRRGEPIITMFVGAYMTAAREFAELGQPLLVKWAFQAGAGLAEERSLGRAIQAMQGVSDTNPPDNKAFETDLFLYVRDAYVLMTRIGLFGGLPVRMPYPSRDTVQTLSGPVGSKVLQKVPNNATISITSPGEAVQERP